MKSSPLHPFAFFEDYFEERIFLDWKDFKKNTIDEYGSNILSIDENVQEIIVQDVNLLSYTFSKYLKRKLKIEVNQSRRLIEQRYQETETETDRNSLTWFLKLKKDRILNLPAFKKFQFLESHLHPIFQAIENFGILQVSSSTSYPRAYNLTATSELERIQKAEKLFNLLTKQPAIIDANKDDFINAFTGKDVGEGVKWLMKGKNKLINKRALIYFINELIEQNHLPAQTINDFNILAENVFRDSKGEYLKNFRQSKSKSNESTFPMGYESLDHIISRL